MGSGALCRGRGSKPFDLAVADVVLLDLDASAGFLDAVRSAGGIRQAYIVTDDETQFQVLAGELPSGVESIRLYTAYLENFQIALRD